MNRRVPRYGRLEITRGPELQVISELDLALRTIRRPNGDLGVVPCVSDDGETEVAHFMCDYIRLVLPFGRNDDDDAGAFTVKEVCEGGGEVLLTSRRIIFVLVLGDTILGQSKETGGVVFVADFPHHPVISVELIRSRRLFGGLKTRHVRVYADTVSVLDLKPFARFDPEWRDATRISFEDFVGDLAPLVCDVALAAPDLPQSERERLERVRAGAREVHDLDLIARIAAE
jgi:hypothetical protein